MNRVQYKIFARLLTMLRQNSTDRSRIGLLSVECFLYVAQESQTIAELAKKTGADPATVNKAIYPFVPKLNKAGELVQARIPLLKRKKQGNLRSKLIMLSKTGTNLINTIQEEQ
tara:strand:- start:829 stop:1170 length:342 start_codon:yes stop_codon:yes gene_type:complete